MLSRIAGARSILEIGSRRGGSLRAMAEVCVPGAIIRSIDIADVGIRATVEELRSSGLDADCLICDSHDHAAVEWARTWAPYDFVFIDGDHSAEGVWDDWQDYGPMGRCIGFHDIRHQMHGVAQLWNQLRRNLQTDEYVAFGSYLGIGIVGDMAHDA